MRTIKAGDLRERVTLQRPETAVGPTGRPVTEWTDVITVDAGKADVSGREFYAAHAEHLENVVTWTIRHREDIDETWRIVCRGTPYEILAINHLGYMGDFLKIKTQRVTGHGSVNTGG